MNATDEKEVSMFHATKLILRDGTWRVLYYGLEIDRWPTLIEAIRCALDHENASYWHGETL